ncbi:hypothetical protein E2C01_089027 [Portunus trituberculatus]|uniref:Uncharacterized protein n=1 Tax=Portunus trituberculatus TaxID=210409 RepID=A0A5B7JCF3_PORTR|nr:hypothetical protein [Portunus trituberculatus]
MNPGTLHPSLVIIKQCVGIQTLVFTSRALLILPRKRFRNRFRGLMNTSLGITNAPDIHQATCWRFRDWYSVFTGRALPTPRGTGFGTGSEVSARPRNRFLEYFSLRFLPTTTDHTRIQAHKCAHTPTHTHTCTHTG